MWPRQLELTLALWLLVSPFVFGHAGDTGWWATDLLGGYAAAMFALLPYWRPLRRVHLLNLAIAAWLIVYGWARAPAPAAQNELTVGVLLALIAVIPSEASQPPPRWRTWTAGPARP